MPTPGMENMEGVVVVPAAAADVVAPNEKVGAAGAAVVPVGAAEGTLKENTEDAEPAAVVAGAAAVVPKEKVGAAAAGAAPDAAVGTPNEKVGAAAPGAAAGAAPAAGTPKLKVGAAAGAPAAGAAGTPKLNVACPGSVREHVQGVWGAVAMERWWWGQLLALAPTPGTHVGRALACRAV